MLSNLNLILFASEITVNGASYTLILIIPFLIIFLVFISSCIGFNIEYIKNKFLNLAKPKPKKNKFDPSGKLSYMRILHSNESEAILYVGERGEFSTSKTNFEYRLYKKIKNKWDLVSRVEVGDENGTHDRLKSLTELFQLSNKGV